MVGEGGAHLHGVAADAAAGVSSVWGQESSQSSSTELRRRNEQPQSRSPTVMSSKGWGVGGGRWGGENNSRLIGLISLTDDFDL